jgi:hypothetical protein
MPANPQTGSDIEMEDDGDFTVTFSMRLPQPTTPTDEEK